MKSRRDVAMAKLYLHSLPSKNKGEKRFWKQNWNVGSKKFYCIVAIFLLPSLLLCMRKLDNKGALKQLNLVRLSKRFYTLKVRQSRNDFFKPTFLPKNEPLWNLMSTCFLSLFGKNWRLQKDILKFTDLYENTLCQ